MTKVVLSVVVGVFIGAFAMELMNRKSPLLLRSIENRTKRILTDVRRAFAEGYTGDVAAGSRS